MAMIQLIFSFLLVLPVVVNAQSTPIKCYQCNSLINPNCSQTSTLTNNLLLPCSSGATMCRKMTQTLPLPNGTATRTIRQCAFLGTTDQQNGKCLTRVGANVSVSIINCQCNNADGCNGTSHINLPAILLVLSACLAFALPSWIA